MVLLFFALDLRTLSPPLLSQVKQCLLELANLYALSSPASNLKRSNCDSLLEDRVGLCYLQCAGSSSHELKIAYSPRGRNFNLRDFHYAVNHLPSDSYLPPFLEDSGSFLLQDVKISCIINDEVLYSASGKEIEKKIVLISSCLVGSMDSDDKKILLDAADKCISVEFVLLEQKSSQLSDISEHINKFREQICDLENCSFNAYLPDGQIFNGLAKRWLRELKESVDELFAHFLFQRSIAGSVSKICCKLCNSTNQIMDGFSFDKTHRYHGIQRDEREGYMFDEGVLNHIKMAEEDNTENNFTSVGENGVLAEASWQCWKNLYQVPSTILFNIIERTSLASLSEGVMVGRSYIVIPSVQETYTAPEESDLCQLNNRRAYTSKRINLCFAYCHYAIMKKHLRALYYIYMLVFQGFCRALYSMNQGLICWSYCNLEMMRETEFVYYYILQPSDNGLMLLRRLAGAEEFLPFPDADVNDPCTEETDCCIQQCLLDVELRDYNPVLHSGGFHQKLNQLLKESLRPRPVDPEILSKPSTSTSIGDDIAVSSQPLLRNVAAQQGKEDGVVQPMRDTVAVTKQTCQSNQSDEHDKEIIHLTEEWEQLIVGDIPRLNSVLSESNMEKAKTSPPTSRKPLDTRTSKILERLGNPKQIKAKDNSPVITSSFSANPNEITGKLPAYINAADQGFTTTTSSLMKPTFQRLKRKLR